MVEKRSPGSETYYATSEIFRNREHPNHLQFGAGTNVSRCAEPVQARSESEAASPVHTSGKNPPLAALGSYYLYDIRRVGLGYKSL